MCRCSGAGIAAAGGWSLQFLRASYPRGRISLISLSFIEFMDVIEQTSIPNIKKNDEIMKKMCGIQNLNSRCLRARYLTPPGTILFKTRETLFVAKKRRVARKPFLRGRDFLSVGDFTPREIRHIFELASDMKKRPKRYRRSLEGSMMALIFEKPSLRTRTTFTVGIAQLGGSALTLTPADINLGKRESVYDVAKNLERMVDGLMIRTFGHDVCTSLAVYAGIPVINGLTDLEHPCQVLADFFTIIESGKKLTRAKVCYVGDGNNVANSLMLAAASLGATLFVGTPARYAPDPAITERATALAEKTGGRVQWTEDPVEAVRDADVVYTDTWTSMGQEADAEMRRSAFLPYRVDRSLFSHARPDALFMHCLPAHRGEEVTDEIIDSVNSVVFQEAENRLHVQKAIMHELLR
jgi:ornithine carbamoyltransferase